MAVVLRDHGETMQEVYKDRGKTVLPITKVIPLPVVKQKEEKKAQMEFPYYDLYALYDYIVKETAIKDPFIPGK